MLRAPGRTHLEWSMGAAPFFFLACSCFPGVLVSNHGLPPVAWCPGVPGAVVSGAAVSGALVSGAVVSGLWFLGLWFLGLWFLRP